MATVLAAACSPGSPGVTDVTLSLPRLSPCIVGVSGPAHAAAARCDAC